MSQPAIGTRVEHAKFGAGTVKAIAGSGEQCKLTIEFADGTRQLLARFVTWQAPAPPAPRADELLLATILANPDDDAPRLAYADALQERGDPRGELIVVQCALTHEQDPARRDTLTTSAEALLAAHRETWTRAHDPRGIYRFARGFIHDVVLYEPKQARTLLAREPVQRIEIEIEDSGGLLAIDGIERLRSLSLAEAFYSWTNPYSMGMSLEWLADSPRLRGLRSFSIRTFGSPGNEVLPLPPRGFDALARWQFASLEHTALLGLVVDSDAARVLATGALGGATTFAIDDGRWQPGAFETVAEAWFANRAVTVAVPSWTDGARVLEALGFTRHDREAADFDLMMLEPAPQVWRR